MVWDGRELRANFIPSPAMGHLPLGQVDLSPLNTHSLSGQSPHPIWVSKIKNDSLMTRSLRI